MSLKARDVQAPEPSGSPPRSRWRRWLGEALVILLILAGLQWWQTRDAASGMAPELGGVLLDGALVNLQAERGRVVLVHFWAEWCPICSLEEGSIQSLSEDYRVISVATTSGDAAEVKAHMARQGLDFPVLLDEEGAIAREWGLKGVPASFVIGPDGQIRHALIGYTTEIGFRLRLWLAGL